MARTKRHKRKLDSPWHARHPAQQPCPTNTIASNDDHQNQISGVSLEVLQQVFDQLDNVVDLVRVAMVCHDWRELINSCDACWEKVFFRRYNILDSLDYADLPNWREKYIARTLDLTYLALKVEARRCTELGNNLMDLLAEVRNERWNGRPTEWFQREADQKNAILQKAYDRVEDLQRKRDSLLAARKDTSRVLPNMDEFIWMR